MTSSQLAVRRGSQTPRVANFPPYLISAAPEVVDFARFCGLELDPWQQFVLTHGLGMDAAEQWSASKVSTWVPRQNGKGGIIEALELSWLFLPGMQVDSVVHSAHQHRTSKRAYMRLEKIVRSVPSIHRKVSQYRQTNGEQGIFLRDGRMLEYSTRSAIALLGYSSPRVVYDEAQELTDDHIAASLPTLSAMDNWQAWFFGTPPKLATAWCYGLLEDGEDGVERLAHFDWGLGIVDQNKPEVQAVIADPETVYRTNPAVGIRIKFETTVDERKPSGLGSRFPRERLGAWLPRQVAGGVIDPAKWAATGDEASRRSGDVAIAVDISPLRDFASITVYGVREDGLGHAQLLDYHPGTDWIVPRMAEIRAVLDPIAFGMGRGTYASLKAELDEAGFSIPEEPTEPQRGDLLVLNTGDMAAACGQIIDAVRQGTFRVIPAEQYDEAVAGSKIRQTGDTIAWARASAQAETSPLGSLTIGRFTYVTRAPIVRAHVDPLSQIF